MNSKGSSIISDIIRLITLHFAYFISCPPFTCERCFRIVLISLILAPDFNSSSVVFCKSCNAILGLAKSADPPPEINISKRSSFLHFSSNFITQSAPFTLFSSGNG